MTNVEILAGIDILRKYVKDDEWNFHAEHDQIWFGPDEDEVSEEDSKKLDEIGWFISDEGGWSCFT